MKTLVSISIFCITILSLSAQWKSIRPKQAYQNLNALSFSSNTEGWIGGDGHSLYKTSDFGATLNPIAIPFDNGKITAIHTISADSAVVLLSEIDFLTGNNNSNFEKYLLTTYDGGQTWLQKLINNNQSKNLWAMEVISLDTIYLAGDNGLVYRTYNGGTSWDSLNISLSTRSIRALHYNSTGDLLVAGDSGFVYRSTDNGINWSNVHQLSGGIQYGQPLFDFFPLSADTIYACGRGQTAIRSDDGGLTWKELNNQPNTTEFTSIHFKDTLNGVATGAIHGSIAANGGFYTTNDGGRNWNRRSMSFVPGENKYLRDMFVVGNDILAVGELGRILKSTDYGITRSVPNEINALPLTTDIEILSDSIYVMSCRQGGNTMARSTDAGNTWIEQRTSFSQTPLFIANNGNGLLVSTQNDKILKSYDQGISWNETINSSVNRTNKGYFLNPATFVGLKNSSSDLIYSADTLNTITVITGPSTRSLLKVQPINLSTWFVVDDRYDLYRTTNTGNSWTLMNNNSLMSFNFSDSLNGWGVAANAHLRYDGIQQTTDGGATWNQVITNTDFDIHEFDLLEKVGDVIIATCNYPDRQAVLVSTNNGQSWQTNHDLLPYGEATAIEINSFGTWIYNDLIDFVIENRNITATTSSVGIAEKQKSKPFFEFFPNPATNEINLKFLKNSIGNKIQLYNLNGQLMLEKKINSTQEHFNIELPTGIYFIRLDQNIKKLIIK